MGSEGECWKALVDSGSSLSLVKHSVLAAKQWSFRRGRVRLTTVSGDYTWTIGVAMLHHVVIGGTNLGNVEAHVVEQLPAGVDLLVGLLVLIKHGCWIGSRGGQTVLQFGPDKKTQGRGPLGCTVTDKQTKKGANHMEVVDEDFKARFRDGRWHMEWCWREESRPQLGAVWNHPVVECAQGGFDKEVEAWVKDGILVPWEQDVHGSIKHRVPLMAVMQQKGAEVKVRPFMDFRRLNKQIKSFPGGALPTCRDRLREWRCWGAHCAVVDLRKAYLQVAVDKSLWTYQAVTWQGKTYLLTRLGFGLSIAPKVMTAIVNKVLAVDSRVHKGTSSYIDDIFVNEEAVSAQQVVQHLAKFGLAAKEPVQVGDMEGARVLGLNVDKHLLWSREKPLPKVPPGRLTRRQVHSLVGEWLGHFPVCGWLQVSCAYLQRCTAQEQIDWDEEVSQETVRKVSEVAHRLREEGDPAHGKWTVDPAKGVQVWVVLEVGGSVIEDAAWMRGVDDTAHINLAELDAVIKGVNLTVAWGFHKFTLNCDSATVVGWLKRVWNRTGNVHTRALGELLVRRRLDLLRQVAEQEGLEITVQQVSSTANKADALTRVLRHWTGPTVPVGVTLADIRKLHTRHHLGVDRTLQLAREKFGPDISKRMVRKVVSRCQECAQFDPALQAGSMPGHVVVDQVWERLAADLTHVGGKP